MLAHSPTRPLSALPGRKRDHPDDDKTDVGVDAVLSADVGDAPMRQRQYTARVEAPSASAPHAVRENTTRDKSPSAEESADSGSVDSTALHVTKHQGSAPYASRCGFPDRQLCDLPRISSEE